MSNSPVEKHAWKELIAVRDRLSGTTMRAMFEADTNRFDKFSVKTDGLLFDYSKNRIDADTFQKLMTLARECEVEQWRDKMFTGERINTTEDRAVLHTALRRPVTDEVMVDGENVMPFVHDVLNRMKEYSDGVRSGKITGYTGKKLRQVVNIGIGGSDLGPYMVCEALKPFADREMEVHFVSNVDGSQLGECLKKLNPETTLFIIASKTFTTQETMANAKSAKAWLIEKLGTEAAIEKHFCALSTNKDAVSAFGINTDAMFPFRDWVGGRYSLWSAIGLSICMALGFDKFRALLDGAHDADMHFRTAPIEKNIPVIMGMMGVWYRNFWNADTHAVLPYDQYLHAFPTFLQQMDMESNGKNVDRESRAIDEYETGPIVFGAPGTNGQHAFYQLIHQGTSIVPCDFIASKETQYPLGHHHELLLNNMLAQSQALMQGRTLAEAGGDIARVFEGNRPSNVFIFDRMDPRSLGMLIALYEHKVFVQGIIWNINSYDQFGVELGKELAKNIESGKTGTMDSSTKALLNYLKS